MVAQVYLQEVLVMSFTFKPAIRTETSLLIGIAGNTGSGKTYSALRLATGLAGDGKIAVIDTEAGRALHYADQFNFDHGEITAPFSPEAYTDAILNADAAGYRVIVVDSMSHEWEGEGGVKDMHEANLLDKVEQAMKRHRGEWGTFDREKTADRLSVGAWGPPKQAHKRMMSKILQVRAHLIFCLRADEKLEIKKVKDGKYTKTVIVQPADKPIKDRYVPICEKRFMYEMTVSMVMTLENQGVPIPIKIQDQHRFAFPDGKKVTEESGQLLAAWATGKPQDQRASAGPVTRAGPDTLASTQASVSKEGSGVEAHDGDGAATPDLDQYEYDLLQDANAAADRGQEWLEGWFKRLSDEDKVIARAHEAALAARAREADRQNPQ